MLNENPCKMKKLTALLFTLSVFIAHAQNEQPKRPDDFSPFRYNMTVEELNEKYSAEIMEKGKQEKEKMMEVINSNPYRPDLEKIARHQTLEWYNKNYKYIK